MFDSIDDGPIDRLFIIDNGSVISGAQLRWPWHVGSTHVTDPGYNMGVAASWNHIIKANMEAPWWLIVNSDFTFEKGSLRRLAESIDQQTEPTISRLQVKNEDWGNHFGAFAINRAAVEYIGWFDENLYPIYFEDTDWMRRAEELDIQRILVPSRSFHAGNESWKGNEVLAKANKQSWAGNVEYFDDKWERIRNGSADPTVWYPPSISRLINQAWPVSRKDSGSV